MAKNNEQDLAAKVEELQQQNAILTEQHAALISDKEAAEKTVSALMEQLAAAANANADTSISSVAMKAAPKPIVLPEPFEVDGVVYQFLKPAFNLNSVDYTAAQAAAQPELLAALLAVEGQNIVKVN